MPDEPVRRARTEDGPAIAEILLRSRRAAEIPAGVHSDAEVRAWVVEHLLPSCEVWVVAEAGDPVAVMALSGGWVEQLYVAPEHQRRGHGSRLLRLAQAEQDNLRLWTFQTNLAAQRFYEEHGFQREGPVSDDNEERAPAIRYRWQRSS